MMEKQALRQRLLRQLRAQSESQRRRASAKIARRLTRLKIYREARTVLCYAAIAGEVETRPILEQALVDGKRVAVPVVRRGGRLAMAQICELEKDLVRRGRLGIPEPVVCRRMPLAKLDLVVVPGVAFDRSGRRLGRGGGYFDRFLARLPRRVATVGVGFRFQMVKKIPWETHDRAVDRVITDK